MKLCKKSLESIKRATQELVELISFGDAKTQAGESSPLTPIGDCAKDKIKVKKLKKMKNKGAPKIKISKKTNTLKRKKVRILSLIANAKQFKLEKTQRIWNKVIQDGEFRVVGGLLRKNMKNNASGFEIEEGFLGALKSIHSTLCSSLLETLTERKKQHPKKR